MIIQKPSPNFSSRKGYTPIAIVLHTMAGSLRGTDYWFANPNSQVSSHYGIGNNGEIHQYVQENNSAWANGRVKNPRWKLIKPGINPNLYTISIEHEGYDLFKAPQTLKFVSGAMIRDICVRYSIPMDREHIIGHYEIFSGKPYCPASDKGVIDELIKIAKEKLFNPSFTFT